MNAKRSAQQIRKLLKRTPSTQQEAGQKETNHVMIANRKVGHLHSFDVFAAVSLSLFCASSKTQHNENQGEKENLLSTSSRKLMYAENRYPIRERNIPIVFATGLIYKKITCRQKAVRDNPDFFNFVFLPCSHLLLREHPLSNASRL